MIPVKIDETDYDYPSFQPDQILTADDLNHVFNFLDLQERLTRTNLIGIGIVCGLKVSKSTDGKVITITKGTGVTSHGYLIVHGIENSEDPVEYKKYRNFDALKDRRYDVFVSGNTQKYALWELIDKDHEEATDTELSNAFLTNKVCLLFYEILEENAKNCDPTSCDDKGVKVYINIRKLLVSVNDADTIIAELNAKAKMSGSGEVFPGILDLPEIKLPRFDVLATPLQTANDVYEGYQKVFTKAFVENTGKALKEAFETFKHFLKGSTNPFNGFVSQFKFLYDGSIGGNDLLHFQYYYDFFYELLLAYNEWRESARHLVTLCTPPEALFPRHLFIGALNESNGIEKSKYRNYFIPSPIHDCHGHSYKEFLYLFQRVERMIQNLKIPFPSAFISKQIDANIRITPSLLGVYPLGDRAIPYYYTPNVSNKRLLEVWNPALTFKGREKQILHYNPSYNTTDDFVKNPLHYDLEPYNFFRIEGHIGKQYISALATINNIRDTHRLPFDVVAVTVDSLPGTVDPAKFPCHFKDLEALYETLRAEFMCKLCKALVCLYKIPSRSVGEETGELKKSALNLIKGCGDILFYRDTSIGSVYEQLHQVMIKTKTSGVEIIETMKKENLVKMMRANVAEAPAAAAGYDISDNETDAVIYFVQVIQMVVSLGDTIPEKLADFKFNTLSGNLKKITALLKKGTTGQNVIVRDRFTAILCLRELLTLCDLAAFRALYEEYIERITKIKLMQTLGEFSKSHPGLQHKGGVPTGGTFILVYRDLATDQPPDEPDDAFTMGDFIVAEAEKITITNVKKKVVLKAKYTPQEVIVLTKKINKLKLKGLSNAEIEETLELKIADVLQDKGAFETKITNISHGTVIADFYLPYLCCSDCPPVQFVINVPPPKVEFGLDETVYCNEDPEEYVFHTNPTGGTIVTEHKDAVVEKDNKIFAFKPSGVTVPAGQKSVTASFTYTVEDQSQTISVTVYRKPAVKIIVKDNPDNPMQFDFSMDSPDMVTSADWKFGDGGGSSVIDPPPYTYKKGGEYTVSLEVKNGPCTSQAEDIQITVKDPDPVKVDIKYTEICKNIEVLPFTIIPPGGKLTGEAFDEPEKNSGKYEFYPPKVAMNGLSQKPITFNYTSLQNQSATFKITVFEKPEGDHSFSPEGALRLRVFLRSLKHAAQAIIDFGDGKAETYSVAGLTQFITPPHQYTNGGSYIINITLVNGPCRTDLQPLTATVENAQPRPEAKKCLPLTLPFDRYTGLKESMSGSPEFMEAYKPVLNDVERYFTALSKATKEDGSIDPAFFKKFVIQAGWITSLPVTPAAARTLSIQMLLIYIYDLVAMACLQKEDIDGNTYELFKLIISKLGEVRSLNAKEKQMLLKLAEELQSEIENISNHGEAGIKKNYLTLLKQLIEVLKKMAEG